MCRVLIVDDAPLIRNMLSSIIQDAGHEVIAEASNGAEALELYRDLKPDLVTMDIHMPTMDGLSALKRLIDQDPAAKVIMCSTIGQSQLVLDAVKSGAKDYIIKPFQKFSVMDAVNRVANMNCGKYASTNM